MTAVPRVSLDLGENPVRTPSVCPECPVMLVTLDHTVRRVAPVVPVDVDLRVSLVPMVLALQDPRENAVRLETRVFLVYLVAVAVLVKRVKEDRLENLVTE